MNRFSALHSSTIEADIFGEEPAAAAPAIEKVGEAPALAPDVEEMEAAPPAASPVPSANTVQTAEAKAVSPSRQKILEAKVALHRKMLEEFNLAALEKLPRDHLVREIHNFVTAYVAKERLALNNSELEQFVGTLVDEMTGLGPLEPMMRNPDISDILINGPNNCYAEIRGVLQPVVIPFKDEAHLLRIVNKIVAAVGRRIDESNPMCDARMADGSRFNAAIRPIAIDGPLVSIRKFSKNKLSLDKLVEFNAIAPQMAMVLKHAVSARMTTIISGGTGTGKTTMLNALSAFISPKERVITIEDAAELALQIPHVGRMETRPANNEGTGEIKQRDLVKNALRMRPDRVILGECRGEEAFDMLQAMNTGHEGSMATIHANTPRDAISRLEQMLGMTGMPMTVQSIRSQISGAIHLIVQLTRLADGQRKVTSIAEVTGMEGDVIQMQEIFKYKRTATGPNGEIIGHFEATGVRPRFLEHLVAMGIRIPGDVFEPGIELK
ncbi:MAG: CpaF family protein [Rhizobiaceae bacterium]